ncbi:MAG: ribosome biogenesis GTPase YlqF [Ruminococcaceae bacterium]|nr:ribosome biogenesis GTPase YlqF [Oscillospiraceae bacterium]
MPSTQIQWFPGHMAKTRRLMKESLPSVDILINVLDSRIPISSKNPEIDTLAENKPVLTLLSKSSLADPAFTAKWKNYYKENNVNCLFIDSITGANINEIMPMIRTILQEKIERYEQKGMSGRNIKAMIVGIPNSGKSSLINKLAGSKKVKVEDRPGVTLTKQWVPTSIGLDLMDMPGVLWPKFDDEIIGENLALTGAIRDAILDIEGLAVVLCARLRKLYPELLMTRYKLTEKDLDEDMQDYEVFEAIGRKRGFLISGGEINYERTATMLLDEFRGGKIGKITLELPPVD